MTNIEEHDSLAMIYRILSGEENVLEKMEKEGQQRAINNTMVAKRMFPSKEEWEQVGFTFSEIPGDKVLCNASLPEGWKLVPTEHPMWNEIIDEKGRKRGSMFYKAAFYDRDAHMFLDYRYEIHHNYIDNGDSIITEIYFGNKDEKLFVADPIITPKNRNIEDTFDSYEEENFLIQVTKDFADANYPDWRKVQAYWDDEKEISHEKAGIKKELKKRI